MRFTSLAVFFAVALVASVTASFVRRDNVDVPSLSRASARANKFNRPKLARANLLQYNNKLHPALALNHNRFKQFRFNLQQCNVACEAPTTTTSAPQVIQIQLEIQQSQAQCQPACQQQCQSTCVQQQQPSNQCATACDTQCSNVCQQTAQATQQVIYGQNTNTQMYDPYNNLGNQQQCAPACQPACENSCIQQTAAPVYNPTTTAAPQVVQIVLQASVAQSAQCAPQCEQSCQQQCVQQQPVSQCQTACQSSCSTSCQAAQPATVACQQAPQTNQCSCQANYSPCRNGQCCRRK
ncbi:Protein CBG22747 [Caenorhabditis briggsae]|uniref:Protein CBG22747 n=1 Tax=Caenorhabditis briggsae TaxID=6238 RepID=A8Y330_CAEBR|nr:Protein CBG22747 [Caenorhabditis briggsae]CAP39267.2 Protein CBG22747 [Caenorhabditis briggsae]